MTPLFAMFLFAGVDHAAFDSLLKKYVNAELRVDYNGWKNSKADVAALDAYLLLFKDTIAAEHEKAALINFYNAAVIRWILQHYPVASIWKTKKPFSEARHVFNGSKHSLDSIETRLRAMNDPRIHAALVCAARSCPPLRREAYVSATLDQQLDDNTREWLKRPDLNEFDVKTSTARISMIFKWYAGDFKPGVPDFLARYNLLPAGKSKIDYQRYNWGLNDQGTAGADYGGAGFYLDYLRNR